MSVINMLDSYLIIFINCYMLFLLFVDKVSCVLSITGDICQF